MLSLNLQPGTLLRQGYGGRSPQTSFARATEGEARKPPSPGLRRAKPATLLQHPGQVILHHFKVIWCIADTAIFNYPIFVDNIISRNSLFGIL